MASTRNRIGHFGRLISGRNEPERRETAQNAPKRPENGPPPCPVWEMNSDPSDPTYVRSCAHLRRAPEQAVAASVRTGADGTKQHRSANPIKDRTNVLPAAAAPVHSRLISPSRDQRKGFSWVPSLRFARASVDAPAPQESGAFLLASTHRGRTHRSALAVTARASSASPLTSAACRPSPSARTQRHAAFFAGSLRMRTI
jgi:hypothetical protein